MTLWLVGLPRLAAASFYADAVLPRLTAQHVLSLLHTHPLPSHLDTPPMRPTHSRHHPDGLERWLSTTLHLLTTIFQAASLAECGAPS